MLLTKRLSNRFVVGMDTFRHFPLVKIIQEVIRQHL